MFVKIDNSYVKYLRLPKTVMPTVYLMDDVNFFIDILIIFTLDGHGILRKNVLILFIDLHEINKNQVSK